MPCILITFLVIGLCCMLGLDNIEALLSWFGFQLWGFLALFQDEFRMKRKNLCVTNVSSIAKWLNGIFFAHKFWFLDYVLRFYNSCIEEILNGKLG